MTPEQEIVRALQALAENDRELEAPPEVENRLQFAFRQRQRRRTVRTRVAWTLAAAAIFIAIIAIGSRPARRPQAVEVVNRLPEAIPQVVATVEPVAPPIQRFGRVRRPPAEEVMTDFFPLVDGSAPIERGELLRVSLPASAMRTVGLPVREDRLSERVQADVLVSEEGMATAIRFVKYSGEIK